MKQKEEVRIYLILCIAAALLLVMLVYFGSFEDATVSRFNEMIVGAVFIACCTLGITFAFRPGWLRQGSKSDIRKRINTNGRGKKRRRVGHHPDCQGFKAHIVRTDKGVFCAGCMGLAAGSVVSLIIMGVFIVLSFGVPEPLLYILLISGFALITYNFGETMNSYKDSRMHFLSNLFLVMGFLFVVLGVYYLTNNLAVGLLAIVMTVLFMDTRIRLSRWRHRGICETCPKECKAYLR